LTEDEFPVVDVVRVADGAVQVVIVRHRDHHTPARMCP